MALKVVLVGCGFGGLTLIRDLESSGQLIDLTVIDKSDGFSVGGFNQFILDSRMQPSENVFPYSSLKSKSVKFVNEEVLAMDSSAKTVTTTAQTIPFDELVIATGIETKKTALPGLDGNGLSVCSPTDTATARDQIAKIESGRIHLMACRMPYKCPPVLYEWALVIDEILRKRGVREQVSISVSSPETQPMQISGKPGLKVLENLKAQNIAFLGEHIPQSVDGARKCVVFPSDEISYDILIAMPPNIPSPIWKTCGLANDQGFIPVDPLTMKVKGQSNVYAMGDLAGVMTPSGKPSPKAGFFAVVHAQAVAQTMTAIAQAKSKGEAHPEPTPQLGKAQCNIELSSGREGNISIDLFGGATPSYNLEEGSEPTYGALKAAMLRDIVATWFN